MKLSTLWHEVLSIVLCHETFSLLCHETFSLLCHETSIVSWNFSLSIFLLCY